MTNPAQELLDQFKSWKTPRANPEQARGLKNPQRADEVLLRHVTAMERIGTLVQFIDELERRGEPVERYRRGVPMWIKAVLTYPAGWKSQQQADNGRINDQLFAVHAMDILEGLAVDISRFVPELDESNRDMLSKLVDDIAELLVTDEDLDQRLRWYLRSLLQHTRDCLDDFATHGTFDLREALLRLWVAVQAAENGASGETKAKWSYFKDKIWPGAFGGFLGSLPQLGVALGEITQSGT